MRKKLFDLARSTTAGALVLWCLHAPAAAHSPHDDIFDVAVAGGGTDEPTIVSVVRSAVMISRDGGDSWQRVVRGLENKNILYALVDCL